MYGHNELSSEQILKGMEEAEAKKAERLVGIGRILDFVSSYVSVDDEGQVHISAPTEGEDKPNYDELRRDIFLTVTMGEIQEHTEEDVLIAVAKFVWGNATPRGSEKRGL